jgi:hypothetical protein
LHLRRYQRSIAHLQHAAEAPFDDRICLVHDPVDEFFDRRYVVDETGEAQFPLIGDLDRPWDDDSRASADKTVLSENRLSENFYELIYELDPEAKNDDYYVTSADFIELHSEMKAYLITRIIWWATSACLYS